MPFVPHPLFSLLAVVPGFVTLGRFQLPVFGIVVTAGTVAALLLSRRTAHLSGLDPERLWDAGIFAVVSAFVASRLLLVAVHVRLFLTQPLLVLAQPSLTFGGLALAGCATVFRLNRLRLLWRAVLDAWAAPAALLASVLQGAHFVEGTDAGMPTALAWGVHTPGDLTFARVHPVQLYAAAAYLALGWCLLAGTRQPQPAGRLAAVGLLAGGGASFLLGFLRQPYETFGSAWLDPEQYAALLAILAGASLLLFSPSTPLPGMPSLPPVAETLPAESR